MSHFQLLQGGSDYFIIFNYFLYLTQGKICTNGTVVIAIVIAIVIVIIIVNSHVNITLIFY